MTDTAREKVAEALRGIIHEWAAGMLDCEDLADAAIAAHLDALKTDGYAIVKLPAPAYGPDREGRFTWRPSVSTVTATPNDDGSWSVRDEDFDMTPSDAQELAATLLAAAAKSGVRQ